MLYRTSKKNNIHNNKLYFVPPQKSRIAAALGVVGGATAYMRRKTKPLSK